MTHWMKVIREEGKKKGAGESKKEKKDLSYSRMPTNKWRNDGFKSINDDKISEWKFDQEQDIYIKHFCTNY